MFSGLNKFLRVLLPKRLYTPYVVEPIAEKAIIFISFLLFILLVIKFLICIYNIAKHKIFQLLIGTKGFLDFINLFGFTKSR